jgi:hypothetical protein
MERLRRHNEQHEAEHQGDNADLKRAQDACLYDSPVDADRVEKACAGIRGEKFSELSRGPDAVQQALLKFSCGAQLLATTVPVHR